MNEIATIKHEVARLLDEDVELTELNLHVYSSRQMPMLFERELAVFSIGSAPNQFASLGKNSSGASYRYGIQFIVKYQDAAEFEETEDICLDIENAIYRILGTEYYNHSMWRKIIFPEYSSKPPTEAAVQNVHIGLIEIRIHP